MRLPARFTAFFTAAVFVAAAAASAPAQATSQNSDQNPAQNPGQSSSSQNSSSQNPTATVATSPQTPGNGTYVSVNPLAGVRYDNRFDLSLGLAYRHMKAGPTLLQGSNLGGLDLSGSMWLSKNWGLQTSQRFYVGTSGAGTSTGPTGGNAQNNIKGPLVSEYFFTAGPEWLGPHNMHGAIMAHVLVGGVYGNFERDLLGQPPSTVAFYNNQVAPAIIAGGHFDLNRSPRWVFRITPDAIVTHYGINYAPHTSQFDVNFAISVGMMYKFKGKR
jgi:hypothetical protein